MTLAGGPNRVKGPVSQPGGLRERPVPNWRVGETLPRSPAASRSAAPEINEEMDVNGLEELYSRGINGIWTVEPLD